MMDRDFPPTPLQWRLTVLGLAISAVVGILLFGGYLPGLHPSYTPNPIYRLDGRSYYWTPLGLPIPSIFPGRTSATTEVFHNVTFRTWLTDWSVFGAGAYLHGNATEKNGTVYDFAIGGYTTQTNWTEQYVSPGGSVAVLWNGGWQAYLLVLV